MEKILLWGTGKVAEEVLTHCQTLNRYHIVGIIDNNIQKAGMLFHDYTVYEPKEIRSLQPDVIVLLVYNKAEIIQQIAEKYPEYVNCIENQYFFSKQSMLQRYADTEDLEIKEVIEHIKSTELKVFNYPFVEKYENICVDIHFDKDVNLFYVFHFGKRMYFSKKYKTEKEVKEYYKSILLEQDKQSPHKYTTEDFGVAEGDVVVDVGAAEGNFALEVIDSVSKIYLIEADLDWIEALKVTFREYMDKVVIIQGFISSYNTEAVYTLDALINESVNFIKMDIEGSEWDGLNGARHLIECSPDIKLAICCYHADFDQFLIEKIMDEMKIEHSTTPGYMWFPDRIRQNYISSRLNRGIVRGIKRD